MKLKNLTGSKQMNISFLFHNIIKSPFHGEGLNVTQDADFWFSQHAMSGVLLEALNLREQWTPHSSPGRGSQAPSRTINSTWNRTNFGLVRYGNGGRILDVVTLKLYSLHRPRIQAPKQKWKAALGWYKVSTWTHTLQTQGYSMLFQNRRCLS